MMQFKAFKPQALNKIAGAMGYKGDMSKFQQFVESDPQRKAQMDGYTNVARMMARGGLVNMNIGGMVGNLFGQQAAAADKSAKEAADAFNKQNQAQSDNFFADLQKQRDAFNAQQQQTVNQQNAAMRQQMEAFNKQQGTPATGAASTELPKGLRKDRDFVKEVTKGRMYTQVMPSPGMEYAYDSKGVRYEVPKSYFDDASNTADTTTTPTTPSYTPPTQATTPTSPTFVSNPVTKDTPVTKPVLDEKGEPVLNEDGTQKTEPVLDEAGNPVMQSTLQIGDVTTNRMFDPRLPSGGVIQAQTTPVGSEQLIAQGTGDLGDDNIAVSTAQAAISQADAITAGQANTMQSVAAAPGIDAALNATQAAQTNPDDPRAKVTAAQQTASSVGNLDAAQGNAILMDNPVQREIQDGELIDLNSISGQAQKAAKFAEEIQAAEATPSQQAMVQGQLANLTQDFDAANPPAWAAGALRNANSQMAARGLGASSIAGQAIIQATLEAALPIAQADAQTTASFESQNLSNRQQRAMLSAEQRAKFIGQEFDQAFQARVINASKISDVANQNFTAEQQIALENSRIANTMNLANLSNSQALVMAQASAVANLDMANLSNRQQASVQNAQNFLQMDMANLSNKQQTELFKSQQRIQGIFTDQAAENAARQFNASSQNQVDQFYANLGSQVSQFNASQANAQAQFNAGQINTIERFNAELNNQRDQFNAQNQLVIAQSNAQWRREIATADTAAINRVNELNATNVLDISKTAYDNLWQYFGDTMEWAWKSAENQIDRNNALAIAELDAKTQGDVAARQSKSAAGSAIGNLIGTLGSAWIMCWVAREVYGKSNPEWFLFRAWLQYDAPKWFRELYKKHGEQYASFISNKPVLKYITKMFMDNVIASKRRRHNVQTV